MFKQFLTGGFVFVVLLTGGLSAQAQTQPKAQEAPQVKVSPQELQKFASVIKQLQVIQQQTRTEMTQAVQQQGLSEERFIQIYQEQQDSQPNPQNAQSNTPPNSKITPQEKQNFEQALTKIKGIQQQSQSKMKQAVQSQGFEVQRFNQIMASVRQDPALQQKVRQML